MWGPEFRVGNKNRAKYFRQEDFLWITVCWQNQGKDGRNGEQRIDGLQAVSLGTFPEQAGLHPGTGQWEIRKLLLKPQDLRAKSFMCVPDERQLGWGMAMTATADKPYLTWGGSRRQQEMHFLWLYNPLREHLTGTILLCLCSVVQYQLFGTPWTVAHQAPLSMGFFREEY